MASPAVNFQRTAPVFSSRAVTSWFHEPKYSTPLALTAGAVLIESSLSTGPGGCGFWVLRCGGAGAWFPRVR